MISSQSWTAVPHSKNKLRPLCGHLVLRSSQPLLLNLGYMGTRDCALHADSNMGGHWQECEITHICGLVAMYIPWHESSWLQGANADVVTNTVLAVMKINA